MSLTNIQDIDNEVLLLLGENIIVIIEYSRIMDNLFWIRRFKQKYGASLVEYGVNHRKLYKEWQYNKSNDIFLKLLNLVI